MKKEIWFFLCAATLVTGCSLYRISSEEAGDNLYQSRNSANDVVYVEDLGDKAYEVIGTVIVNAERRQSMDEVIQKIKREAAVMGGDAVTDIHTDASGAWKKLPAQALIGNAYVRANFSAKVVVFKSEESKARLIE
jgi:hypothetical protein